MLRAVVLVIVVVSSWRSCLRAVVIAARASCYLVRVVALAGCAGRARRRRVRCGERVVRPDAYVRSRAPPLGRAGTPRGGSALFEVAKGVVLMSVGTPYREDGATQTLHSGALGPTSLTVAVAGRHRWLLTCFLVMRWE